MLCNKGLFLEQGFLRNCRSTDKFILAMCWGCGAGWEWVGMGREVGCGERQSVNQCRAEGKVYGCNQS